MGVQGATKKQADQVQAASSDQCAIQFQARPDNLPAPKTCRGVLEELHAKWSPLLFELLLQTNIRNTAFRSHSANGILQAAVIASLLPCFSLTQKNSSFIRLSAWLQHGIS